MKKRIFTGSAASCHNSRHYMPKKLKARGSAATVVGTCSMTAPMLMLSPSLLSSCRLKGGVEAERAERARIKEEAAARDQRNFEWMQNLRKQGFRKVRGWQQSGARCYAAYCSNRSSNIELMCTDILVSALKLPSHASCLPGSSCWQCLRSYRHDRLCRPGKIMPGLFCVG